MGGAPSVGASTCGESRARFWVDQGGFYFWCAHIGSSCRGIPLQPRFDARLHSVRCATRDFRVLTQDTAPESPLFQRPLPTICSVCVQPSKLCRLVAGVEQRGGCRGLKGSRAAQLSPRRHRTKPHSNPRLQPHTHLTRAPPPAAPQRAREKHPAPPRPELRARETPCASTACRSGA